MAYNLSLTEVINNEMTPLEKASQLIVDYQLTIRSLDYDEAVECSIRTVDEIIWEIIKYADNSREYVIDNIKYWQEVKQLLEKQLNKNQRR
jgi:hypothetical protein